MEIEGERIFVAGATGELVDRILDALAAGKRTPAFDPRQQELKVS